MAPNMPFSRPWNRTFLPAGALLAFIMFFFVFQNRDNINFPPLHDDHESKSSTASSSSSSSSQHPPVAHTTPAKTKVIITSVQKKDETTADWLAEFLPDWQAVVYVTDRTSDEEAPANSSLIRHHLPVNKGREASVYLTYIVQHYYHLPDYMVFIHGKRYQIHNDDPMLDTLPLVKRLNLNYVEKEGYASLRCNWMQCPNAQVEPILDFTDDFWDIKGLYASAWTEFFPNEPLPDAVTGPCCAQFALTREAVQRLPIDKYEQIRQWIWTLEVPSGEASMKSGLVLEYLWHIMFGKPAYYCPPAKECYCERFGMCDLECEREGWCLGRVWQNPQKNPALGLLKPIPDGWPEQGQSEPGKGGDFPYMGWEKDPQEVLNH